MKATWLYGEVENSARVRNTKVSQRDMDVESDWLLVGAGHCICVGCAMADASGGWDDGDGLA